MLAVVRIGGHAGLERDVKDTLKMLKLDAIHDCVLVPNTPDYKGMVEKVRNHVTYGEIDKQTLAEILRKRLKSTNNERILDDSLKSISGHNSCDELADDLLSGKVRLSQFKKLQPVLRLSSPSKGFKSTKSHYPEGDLGYRKNTINRLLERMI
ncbi:MAG: 50S ribosomal protein L30 [Candidatus Aenigmarchaeota archaeon]|nr:50S ribosomal protein L30 [Candidatus Aenigmarchaeota archaeon]